MEPKELYMIYVACLASYNAGILHGRWIELDEGVDEEEILEQIQEMLEESPIPNAEEWAIHDYDWPSHHDLGLGEYTDLSTIVALANALYRHDEEALIAAISNSDDIEGTIEDFDNGDYRIYENIYEWGEQEVDLAMGGLYVSGSWGVLQSEATLDDLPSIIRNNLDWRGMLADAQCDRTIIELSGDRLLELW